MRFKQIIANLVLTTAMFSVSCNLSDESKKLPGGHTYVDEGKCYKFILVNIKNEQDIGSSVSGFKYDDDYITVVQDDSTKCEQSVIITPQDRKYFIIDVKKEKLLGPYTSSDFISKFKELGLDKDLLIE